MEFKIKDQNTGVVYVVKLPSRQHAVNEVDHQNRFFGKNYILLD